MINHNPMNIATDFAKATGGNRSQGCCFDDKGPLNGFKKFLSRGSMIDMAVGVVFMNSCLKFTAVVRPSVGRVR